MTVGAFPAEAAFEDISDAETSANKNTKLITAVGLGALSLAAWYVESKHWVDGWPPPSHSFRHPAVGYYGAWLAGKFSSRKKVATAVGGGIGNVIAESADDIKNRPDHHPFHWANIGDGAHNHNASNVDNSFDLALAMGGAALLLAQDNGVFSRARLMLARLRGRLNDHPQSLPSPID